MPTPRRTLSSSSTSTPTQAHAHHISSDERAIAEAHDLLLTDDDDAGPSELLSPRAQRHAALTRKREASADPGSAAGTPLRAAAASQSLHAVVASTPTAAKASGAARSGGGAEGDASESLGSGLALAGSGSSDDVESDEEVASGSSSSEGSDSSDSESDSEDSASDESSDDEDEFERQLAAAKATAAKATGKGCKGKHSSSTAGTATALGENDDGELLFETEDAKDAPIPDLSVPSLPPQVLSFAEDGTARTGSEAGPSEQRELAPELDRGAYQRALSKREKAAQPKKASASELWATIPSARSDDLAQMKRDYQALALANTLDPKRFMKGGNRAGKVPEKFAIGTLIEQSRTLQDTTVQKERKYRAGEIVSGLIADTEVGSYAKRKFEDLQGKRMANGRGRGWQKRAKW